MKEQRLKFKNVLKSHFSHFQNLLGGVPVQSISLAKCPSTLGNRWKFLNINTKKHKYSRDKFDERNTKAKHFNKLFLFNSQACFHFAGLTGSQ